MKQEPVAWMDKETGMVSRLHQWSNAIPLYTAPRELSDEEIDSLIAKYKIGEFSGFYVDKAMTESMQRRYKNVLDFARAILKKASEPNTYKPKVVDMVLRTDNQGNVLPQKEIKESE